MPATATQQWLRRVLEPYAESERVFADVCAVLDSIATLFPRTDTYTYDDGRTRLLLCLSGTLPVQFRSQTYNFPVAIWVPHEYPREPPLVHVVPTSTMVVRPSREVDVSGRVVEEYLDLWKRKPEGCSLNGMVDSLQALFSKGPPLYAKKSPEVQSSQPSAVEYATGNHAQTNGNSSARFPSHRDPPPPPPPPRPHSQSPELSSSSSSSVAQPSPVPPPRPPVPPELRSSSSTVSRSNSAYSHEPPRPPVPRPASADAGPIPSNGLASSPPPVALPSQSLGYTNVSNHSYQLPPSYPPPQNVPFSSQQLVSSMSPQQYSVHHPPYSQPSQPPAPQPRPPAPPPPPAGAAPAPGPPHGPPPHAAPSSDVLPHYYHPPDHSASPSYQETPVSSTYAASSQALPPSSSHSRTVSLLDADTPNILDTSSSSFENTEGNDTSASGSRPPRPPNPEIQSLQEELTARLHQSYFAEQARLGAEGEQLDLLANDLLRGRTAIEDEEGRLRAVREVCAQVGNRYRETVEAAQTNIKQLRERDEVDVDEIVFSTTVASNQLWDLVAEDNAIEDTIWQLGRALNGELANIDLDQFVKRTRTLAREQFVKRALINKILLGMAMGKENA